MRAMRYPDGFQTAVSVIHTMRLTKVPRQPYHSDLVLEEGKFSFYTRDEKIRDLHNLESLTGVISVQDDTKVYYTSIFIN